MDELPPWLSFRSDNPVLRSVLEQMLRNPRLLKVLNARFAEQEGRDGFPVTVADQTLLGQLNAHRPQQEQVNIRPEVGAVALYNAEPDSSVYNGGLFVDVDKIHEAVGQDSARARGLVRDAMLHEFAHLLPVAESRHLRAVTGDPKPGSPNQAQHPIMQGENALRDLFGLLPKTTYGLLGDIR